MNEIVWIQILASVLGSTVFVSLLTAYFNRKKLGAEATDIITKAATGVVEQYKSDNIDLRNRDEARVKQIARMTSRIEHLELAERERNWELHTLREQLQIHAAWDYVMMERLRKCDPVVAFDNPPALMPDWVKHRRKEDRGGYGDD